MLSLETPGNTTSLNPSVSVHLYEVPSAIKFPWGATKDNVKPSVIGQSSALQVAVIVAPSTVYSKSWWCSGLITNCKDAFTSSTSIVAVYVPTSLQD